MDAIPVTVITGFLGAGKTTLLDAWLQGFARGEVAVIVNEVGTLGVDGELLRARVDALLEITGGCVCCTTYNELLRALRVLAAKRPRRIFVETSGAASPAGVVRAIHALEEVRLDGIITVVDATASPPQHRHAADLAAEQLGYADVIVLARADALDANALAQALAVVTAINPAAVIASADRGVVREYQGLDLLLQARARDLHRPTPAASNHQGIETLALSVNGELDEELFGDWIETDLARFESRLLRIKGIVAIAGLETRMILQGVADRIEVSPGSPWQGGDRTSRLVIIGFALDQEELRRGFASCAISAKA